MPPVPPFWSFAGTTPVVLVSPHGGRRDFARRRWGGGPLKVNDLHTAALTVELARATGAVAIANAACDRNDVDLNRISAAEARAPWFLERLHDVLEATVARHGHATLVTVHGWNVVQPAVDVGLGVSPGADPFAVGPGAAVSPAFASRAVRAFAAACAARGVPATVGARYPARARENLLQLFAGRYRDDPRPVVRALAALGDRTEALQLELSIPLRWPGRWRRALADAYAEAFPALAGDAPPARTREEPVVPLPFPTRARIEFAGHPLSGVAGLDGGHGRVLLFRDREPGLLLFTGEQVGAHGGRVGGLTVVARGGGALDVRYDGPLLRFPDTLPFLDLERGLARAELVEGDVHIAFTPSAPGSAAGRVTGRARLGSEAIPVDAPAFAPDDDGTPGPWPRFRAALHLPDGGALSVTAGLDGHGATGWIARDGRRDAIVGARIALAAPDAPLARVAIALALDGGETLELRATAVHDLPVVRSRGAIAIRVFFAACRLDDAGAAPAGWCEAAGI